MTDEDFWILREKLMQGDPSALGQLYVEHKKYCFGILLKRFNCSNDEAEDIYMDALLKLRQSIIKGNISNQNLKAYIGKISQNLFLQKQRKTKKKLAYVLDIDEVEKYLSLKNRNEEQNHLIVAEEKKALDQEKRKKIDAVVWAKSQLAEKCRKILMSTIVDGIKAKDLYLQFGMKSLDVFKTSKNRCKKKLKELVKQFLD